MVQNVDRKIEEAAEDEDLCIGNEINICVGSMINSLLFGYQFNGVFYNIYTFYNKFLGVYG